MVDSSSSRCSFRAAEEATGDKLTSTDSSVGCLGGLWSLAVSGSGTSSEASLKSWPKLMMSASFSTMLQETGDRITGRRAWGQEAGPAD